MYMYIFGKSVNQEIDTKYQSVTTLFVEFYVTI